MKILFLLAWGSVSYNCPFLAKSLPPGIKDFVCTRTEKVNVKVYDDKDDVIKQIKKLGPKKVIGVSRLYVGRGRDKDRWVLKPVPAAWVDTLDLEGVMYR